MSPKSRLSSALESLVKSRTKTHRAHICGILILFGCFIPAFAQNHITVSTSLPAATAAQPYSATIKVSGGSAPYVFVVDRGALPSGLTLSSSGTVSGTPLSAGKYTFHVDVSGAGGSHGDNFITLTVQNGSSVSISVSPKTATVSSGGSQSFTAYVTGTSNTAVTWTASAGSISTAGAFTAPTVSSTTSVSITATSVADNTKKATAAVTVTATSSALTITTTSLPGGNTGSGYGAALGATGGTTPYSWSISTGSLPAGITLDGTTGLLSGTPTTSGTSSFTAKVTDSKSATATQALTLTVSTSSGGSYDGPAELPRVYVQSTMANTPAPGSTITVPAGGNVQAALNSANCGDTVALQAGATFVGKFTLPAKSCDNAHWIIVRTTAPDNALPPEGTRMTPCYGGVASLPGRPSFNCSSPTKALATLSYPGGGAQSGPLVLAIGANHYRILGLEITRQVGTGSVGLLVSGGQIALADHIVIDRCWIHGVPHDDTKGAVSLRGTTYGAVVDSYLHDLHCTAGTGACTDAVAVGGGNGDNPMGPYKIVNNFLESSGENILMGGAGSNTTPADIEVRRNHFFKTLLWMRGAPGFIGGVSGNPFIVKNHFELKNAERVLLEANIFENNWGGFSQKGKSIVLNPRNTYNKTTNTSTCVVCKVQDITIRYSTISHVGGGIGIAAVLTAGQPAMGGQRFSIHDVIIDDVDATRFTGGGGLVLVTNAWPTNVMNSVMVNHVTGIPDAKGTLLTIGNPTTNPKMWGFTFTNNVVYVPTYALWSSGQPGSCALIQVPITLLTNCFSTYAFSNNVLFANTFVNPPSKWPAGNAFTTPGAVGFVNYNNGNGGDYHLAPSTPYKGKASDGRDPGADIDAVMAAIAGVN
jgi:Putative Ig domain